MTKKQADAVRIRAIEMLKANGPMTIRELAARMEMGSPRSLSQMLQYTYGTLRFDGKRWGVNPNR